MKKFVGGMNKDTSKADQPNGTYRDALNAVVSLETGTSKQRVRYYNCNRCQHRCSVGPYPSQKRG